MEKIILDQHQKNAFNAVINSLKEKKKRILVNMPAGAGKTTVLISLLEQLIEENNKILVITPYIVEEETLKHRILNDSSSKHLKAELGKNVQLMRTSELEVELDKMFNYGFSYVFIMKAEMITLSNELTNFDVTFIGFVDMAQKLKIFESSHETKTNLFKEKDCVYSYPIADAVVNGYLSPQMYPEYYSQGAGGFCIRLFKSLGYELSKDETIDNDALFKTDFVFNLEDKKVFAECKFSRRKIFTLQSLNITISQMKLLKNKCYKSTDIVVIIVFGKMDVHSKEVIYKNYNIAVWDISNLLYYVQHDDKLYEELSILSYYPLPSITAMPPIGWTPVKKNLDWSQCYIQDKVYDLKKQLNECLTGTEYSMAYEEICQSIIQFLFPHAFYIISDQHKTDDEHFRMDLLCSLRGDSEHNHEFWKILSRHYNSHFIVFEFKNYNKPIEQNLIYITEKYLFNAALRNVAIVISRKGFSDGAYFAAKGCLKENGKLILSLTDSDLISMLDGKLHSIDPEDYLLSVFEKFLMGISK